MKELLTTITVNIKHKTATVDVYLLEVNPQKQKIDLQMEIIDEDAYSDEEKEDIYKLVSKKVEEIFSDIVTEEEPK